MQVNSWKYLLRKLKIDITWKLSTINLLILPQYDVHQVQCILGERFTWLILAVSLSPFLISPFSTWPTCCMSSPTLCVSVTTKTDVWNTERNDVKAWQGVSWNPNHMYMCTICTAYCDYILCIYMYDNNTTVIISESKKSRRDKVYTWMTWNETGLDF